MKTTVIIHRKAANHLTYMMVMIAMVTVTAREVVEMMVIGRRS